MRAFHHRPRDRQTDMATTTLTARYLITDIGSIEFPVITLSNDGTITDISSDPRALADERDALTAYATKHGLANACRLLWNTNEFVFID